MPQIKHVSLFSVRHLFFGFIWICRSIQFMADVSPPHSITLYSSRRTENMYIIGLQKAIWYIRLVRYIDLYPNLQQMPPPPLCHTQCHQRPPAFTPPTKWRCLFTANRRKIQLLFNDNPEIEAAINTGKYTFDKC